MALDLFEETVALLAELERRGTPYALAGAIALAIHGAPRATTDIDLLVAPPDLDTVLAIARARGFAIDALPMRFSDGLEIRRVVRAEGSDLLTLDLTETWSPPGRPGNGSPPIGATSGWFRGTG
jgi:hypothetical protein